MSALWAFGIIIKLHSTDISALRALYLIFMSSFYRYVNPMGFGYINNIVFYWSPQGWYIGSNEKDEKFLKPVGLIYK